MTESRTWFTIKAKAKKPDPAEDDEDEDEAEVMIYDEIGMWGIGAADFDRALKACGPVKTINMRINSPGGDSFAGIAIYNMLKSHPATVKTRVDGLAASAASLIAMAGDRITMPENTFMVVHEPLAFTIGPASVHRAMADDLDRVAASYASTYATRSGQALESVRTLMAEDRLMSAGECKQLGYCDETCEPMESRATFALDRVPEKHRALVASIYSAAAEPGGIASGEPGGAAPDPALAPGSPAEVAPAVPDPGSPETIAAAPAALAAPAAPTEAPALVVAPPAEPTVPAAPAVPVPAVAAIAASYSAEDASATLELCALAGVPAASAQKYIAAKRPLAEVRAELLEARARESDAAGIVPYPGESGGGGSMPSAEILAGKRRLQAIIRCAEQEKIGLDHAAWMVDNHQWNPKGVNK